MTSRPTPLGPNGDLRSRPGSLLTSHCDPTVNLHDWLHCVRGDVPVDIWPVDIWPVDARDR